MFKLTINYISLLFIYVIFFFTKLFHGKGKLCVKLLVTLYQNIADYHYDKWIKTNSARHMILYIDWVGEKHMVQQALDNWDVM